MFSNILLLALFAVSAVRSDYINKIEVRTADCDDCGMSNTFGALRMQVIASKDIYLAIYVTVYNFKNTFQTLTFSSYICSIFYRYAILSLNAVIQQNWTSHFTMILTVSVILYNIASMNLNIFSSPDIYIYILITQKEP